MTRRKQKVPQVLCPLFGRIEASWRMLTATSVCTLDYFNVLGLDYPSFPFMQPFFLTRYFVLNADEPGIQLAHVDH
jgi:hypothetical protein